MCSFLCPCSGACKWQILIHLFFLGRENVMVIPVLRLLQDGLSRPESWMLRHVVLWRVLPVVMVTRLWIRHSWELWSQTENCQTWYINDLLAIFLTELHALKYVINPTWENTSLNLFMSLPCDHRCLRACSAFSRNFSRPSLTGFLKQMLLSKIKGRYRLPLPFATVLTGYYFPLEQFFSYYYIFTAYFLPLKYVP